MAASPPSDRAEVLAAVRHSVRSLLNESPGFAAATPAQRRDVAHRAVQVAMMGAELLADEAKQTDRVASQAATPKARAAAQRRAPLATAQEFGEAARAAGRTFQQIRQAIDFPTYVQSLITGVFQAMTTSNLQQLTAISDMLDAVARTQDEFSTENIRDADVRSWAVGKFSFLQVREGELQLVEGQDLESHAAQLRTVLQATEDEISSLDDSDLMSTMGPLIRRRIGRERQQILATMVQMGLQRVVVDEGRLHASMEMRVDTRSALDTEQARRQELDIDTGASAQFGTGMWGASAHMNMGFNQVESEHSRSTEEIATRAGLRSSVDLAFRTEQIPLDRMASASHRARLDANARVPVATGESILSTPSAPALPPATAAPAATARVAADRNIAEARAAREAGAAREREERGGGSGGSGGGGSGGGGSGGGGSGGGGSGGGGSGGGGSGGGGSGGGGAIGTGAPMPFAASFATGKHARLPSPPDTSLWRQFPWQ